MTDVKDLISWQMTGSGETFLLAMEPVADDEFFAVNGNGSSAAWVTGHLACTADLFSSWFDGRRMLGRPVHRQFNETDAGAADAGKAIDRTAYPKSSLLLLYRQAAVKALRALRAFDLRQWDALAPAAAPVSLTRNSAVWEHLALHTSWHSGELAGSMPRFFGTYALNGLPHHLYVPPE